MRTDLQKIIKFIFLAIPGVFLFLFASIYLIGWLLEPQARPILPNPLLTTALTFVGMMLLLIGIGRFHNKLYSLVFISVPISIILFSELDQILQFSRGKGLIEMGLFTTGVAFLVFRLVRIHYLKKGKNHQPITPNKSREKTTE